jgi:hypothetical protein
MPTFKKLLDFYTPPNEGYILESLLATTYQVDYEFFEEDLLALALGVRTPTSRSRVFRSDIERRLQSASVSILYDLRGCPRMRRASPRIDALPVIMRKQHAKISLIKWVRPGEDSGQEPSHCARLIVGSANLTRQGFRENYECASALDFGPSNSRGRGLLADAIDLVERMGSECGSPQFAQQIKEFRAFAQTVSRDVLPQDGPIALVTADDALSALGQAWVDIDGSSPELATLVSPFWPEGTTAGEALALLAQRLGNPKRLDLVCRGVQAHNGKDWVPEFDPAVAADLKRKIGSRLFLKPALASAGVEEESDKGDETEAEEIGRVTKSAEDPTLSKRTLHAKMIWLDGKKGSVGYIGSSNCTRRGIGLGKQTNWEAGFIYRLSRASRDRMDLLSIAGEGIEVLANKLPPSKKPERDEDIPVPTFLADIVATQKTVLVRFQKSIPAPEKFEILMPVPAILGDQGYWLIFQRWNGKLPIKVSVDLSEATHCDTNLRPLSSLPKGAIEAAVYVEVRWEGNIGFFPVRFDDKATLPTVLAGRRPTEDELIEYYLFGKEPDWDGDDGGDGRKRDSEPSATEKAVDTRRILSYFIRRFVQAIPGIEAEIRGATYSRTALLNALRGSTSPLELAERAFASLGRPAARDEPTKTPTAVGFQLVEICAALERSKARVSDKELKQCFDPVLARCLELVDQVARRNPELKGGVFQDYRQRILRDAV